jgi:hypothetical protein
LAAALPFTAVVAAVVIAATLSLKLGESALTTAAALAGAALALFLRPTEEALRGLALPTAIALGGWCYVGAIELPPPAPPLVALLFIPPAPLVLWAVSFAPFSRMQPHLRWVIGSLLFVGSLAAIAGWAWTTGGPAGDDFLQG